MFKKGDLADVIFPDGTVASRGVKFLCLLEFTDPQACLFDDGGEHEGMAPVAWLRHHEAPADGRYERARLSPNGGYVIDHETYPAPPPIGPPPN